MVFFAIQHIIFLVYNQVELKNISSLLIASSFYHALSMDLSASAYLITLPFIIIAIGMFFNVGFNATKKFNYLNRILIVVCVLIGLFDTGLYSIWGSKINGKALSYLQYPKEAITAMAAVPYGWFLAAILLQSATALFIYNKIFKFKIDNSGKPWPKIIASIIALGLIFVAIRGGIQKYPLSKSRAYFSKYAVLNYSAVNGFWNFMQLLVEPDIETNPYQYFENSKASDLVEDMHAVKQDSTIEILTTKRPNIVLILMESVSGECLESLNGLKGVMPGLERLTKEGLLFNNFYANGFRTEQGIIACISGFPAQPQTTIMRNFGKFDKLPNLARILGDSGYSVNYYYSGNVEFAKTDAYLKSSGFTQILDKNNYPWQKSTDWGAYDNELFDCHLKKAESDPSPFFSVIMTSTNHEPFNGEVDKVFKGHKTSDMYKNTVHYTDKCISEYLESAKSKSWYNNTIFIITSDHAHSMPNNRLANDPVRHHIPLIFFGNVLKPEFKGTVNSKIGSQIDLPAMVLSQLGLAFKQFRRSKNLFNEFAPEFAYYTFDNGFGLINKSQTIVYDHDANMVVFKDNNVPKNLEEQNLALGKAYLQNMMEEYIHLNN